MKRVAFVIGLILILTSACSGSIPGLPDAGPAPTATPPGDMLQLMIPAYATNLSPEESVPGTRMTFVRRDESGNFIVRINGQETIKRVGDSFLWDGIIGPGVHGAYNLRLTSDVLGELPVAGAVRLTVLDPMPVGMALPADIANYGHYANILVDYPVPLGREIPGTSLSYAGLVQQGGVQSAQLAGAGGLPYYALGDSVVWTGQLREGVYTRLNLRVVSLNEEQVRLGGTVELWVSP